MTAGHTRSGSRTARARDRGCVPDWDCGSVLAWDRGHPARSGRIAAAPPPDGLANAPPYPRTNGVCTKVSWGQAFHPLQHPRTNLVFRRHGAITRRVGACALGAPAPSPARFVVAPSGSHGPAQVGVARIPSRHHRPGTGQSHAPLDFLRRGTRSPPSPTHVRRSREAPAVRAGEGAGVPSKRAPSHQSHRAATVTGPSRAWASRAGSSCQRDATVLWVFRATRAPAPRRAR